MTGQRSNKLAPRVPQEPEHDETTTWLRGVSPDLGDVDAPLTAASENTGYANCMWQAHLLQGLELIDVSFVDCDLSGTVFTECKLRRVRFERCRLRNVQFELGTLANVAFDDCAMTESGFRGTKLGPVSFSSCQLSEIDFSGAVINDASFHDCDLTGAEFAAASCTRVDLRTSTLVEVRGAEFLRGTVIDAAQAIDVGFSLVHQAGIIVNPGEREP